MELFDGGCYNGTIANSHFILLCSKLFHRRNGFDRGIKRVTIKIDLICEKELFENEKRRFYDLYSKRNRMVRTACTIESILAPFFTPNYYNCPVDLYHV